jgi:hypothetical protein
VRRALAAILAASLAPTGCVVVEEEPARPRLPPGERVVIDGPVAEPALSARTVNSRVLASIEPLGTIPYDGQVLPLVSPDGRFLATQVGEAPTWDTLLASRSQEAPVRTWLEVYDLTRSPPRRVSWAEPPPRGLLLGRACDERGFLVESPRPDGSRWIGGVRWVTGELEWFVRSEHCNAFAAFGPGGTVAYSRRDVGSDRWETVLGGGGGEVVRDAVFPTPVGPGRIAAASLRPRAVELVVLFAGEGPGRSRWHVGARSTLGGDGSIAAAHQVFAPVGASSSDERPPGVLFFHPVHGRMAVYDPDLGATTPLADGSVAGAWARDGLGWAVALTTSRGLDHQRVVRRSGVWEALPVSRLLFDSYVPRATTDPARPYVLIGPDQRDGRRLSIMGLSLGGEE